MLAGFLIKNLAENEKQINSQSICITFQSLAENYFSEKNLIKLSGEKSISVTEKNGKLLKQPAFPCHPDYHKAA